MKFIKENWFKLSIVIILSLFTINITIYLNRMAVGNDKNTETDKKDVTVATTSSKSIANVDTSKTKKLPEVDYSSIRTQIIYFEEVLEGKIVEADINCSSLAIYNNILISTPTKITEYFPENKSVYEKKCLDTYVPLNLIRNKLVAEPELQSLRITLSEYLDSVRSLAVYALDGGSSAKIIDEYDREFDQYRIKAREELLRVQRLYKVQPQ
jgi:hypothetical protein